MECTAVRFGSLLSSARSRCATQISGSARAATSPAASRRGARGAGALLCGAAGGGAPGLRRPAYASEPVLGYLVRAPRELQHSLAECLQIGVVGRPRDRTLV